MSRKAPKFSIILAAGKGTRMGQVAVPKACLPVDGVPSVNRAIAAYNDCGIAHHVIVVGDKAGQVVETVGSVYGNALFAYQSEQLGTAHAVKVGLNVLSALDDDGDALVVAGDRLIDLSVLERLFDLFYVNDLDLAFLACPKKPGSSQGRVVVAADRVLGILEAPDIAQRAVYGKLLERANAGETLAPDELESLFKTTFAGSGKKARKALGELWKIAVEDKRPLTPEEARRLVPENKTRFVFRPAGHPVMTLTPEEADRAELVNTSVYLAKISALRFALSKLDRDNAQNEEYLPDIAAILAANNRPADNRPFRVRFSRVDNPAYVLGFNDPAELLEVENYIRSRKEDMERVQLPDAEWFRPLGEWRRIFSAVSAGEGKDPLVAELWDELTALYCDEPEVVREHARNYSRTLDYAIEKLGENEKVFITRSPGRLNVMGRHVDHQGGNCNLMTIGFETLMVVKPRNDDRVRLFNLDREAFGEREFSIGGLVADLPWEDWLSVVTSDKLSKMISQYGVDWSRYVQASVLRLQKKFAHRRLFGMDMFIWGNVPMAAGLSSSSSLVVGSAEAVVEVNQLNTFPSQLVTLCGEGEWFVGTRGGAADHAAVKLGQKGKVVKVTFFDFAVEDIVSFPDEYFMAVCDSGVKAQKSANAKDQFNHRVSCYRIGFLLIKKLFPQYEKLLKHLRDVNVRNLGVPLSWIYKIVLHLPQNATRDELREMLPGQGLEEFFVTHQPPTDGLYPIRGVVLFGLSEFERSRLYADYLRKNRLEEIGRLMNVSHNGDRVATLAADGETMVSYQAPSSNSYLLNIIEDLESGDLDRVSRAQLQWQPGSYHCSIPAIDKMVDIALGVPGVVGAQLAGAGLGGCMMVLAHQSAKDALISELNDRYYRPENAKSGILICRPVAGSGTLLRDR